MAVLGGINLTIPISGAIIQNIGIKGLFDIAGGFGIFLALFCFFFLPETSFHRDPRLHIEGGSHDNIHTLAVEAEKSVGAENKQVVVLAPSLTMKCKPYIQELKLWV